LALGRLGLPVAPCPFPVPKIMQLQRLEQFNLKAKGAVTGQEVHLDSRSVERTMPADKTSQKGKQHPELGSSRKAAG